MRKVANKALKHLKNKDLTAKWMFTENPLFGGLTPAQMVQRGRKGKVIKAIEEYSLEKPSVDVKHDLIEVPTTDHLNSRST